MSAEDTLRELLTELEAARRIFDGERPRDADDDNLRRLGVVRAISAVMTYMRANGAEPRLNAPFHELLGALNDAREGLSNPLLAPNKYVEGSRKKLTKETYDWSVASAVVTILKDDAKWPLEKALKETAKIIGIDDKALSEFRKNIGKGRAPKDAVENYDWFLKQFRCYPGLSSVERAGKLLGILHDMKSAEKG